MKQIDMTGQKIGKWSVLQRGPDQINPNGRKRAMWACRCECGNVYAVSGDHLRSGNSLSCYTCSSAITHGMRNSPEYPQWRGMIARCNNPGATGYRNYGGRGITVCERWCKFDNWLADILSSIGPRPSKDYTLDRIDNDGNYEPGNVRWATSVEQRANRRDIHNKTGKILGDNYADMKGE